MKKNKLITISILGMLLLIPFMIPAKAAYVGVADTDSFIWGYDQYTSDWAAFTADNMEAAFITIFGHDPSSNLTKLYWDWEWTWWTDEPDVYWDLTVDALLPENTTMLLASSFIPDNITHTPYNASLGYIAPQWTAVQAQWTDELEIVNDTSSFAKQSLYGGMATTPLWLMSIPIGPANISWTEFAIEAQLGLTYYWGAANPLAANTTITALSNGYEMFVPVAGYENNTQTITITTTYDSDGVLIYNSMMYGSTRLYTYARTDFVMSDPVVTVAPSDFFLYETYTGESISWTATDTDADSYTITLNGAPLVGATAWTSGVPVVYNIPDAMAIGDYTYDIIFENVYGYTANDSVTVTIEPYVGVNDTDSFIWGYNQYKSDWTNFTADNMEAAFITIFGHDPSSNLTKLYWDWEWTWWTDEPDVYFDLTVDALLPENTTMLLASSFIPDNITHTPYNASLGYIAPQWTDVNAQWTDELEIVNDTSSFAKQSLYGGMATTPLWLMSIPIGPTHINWAEFAIEAQLGLTYYWGAANPLAANTTITALSNGYEMFVPVAGYENNTQTITITTTYDSKGVLLYNSMEYGSNLLYRYLRTDAPAPVSDAPSDLLLQSTYTGENLTWTATDLHPDSYTITLNGAPLVGATAWTSGVPVVYDIPDAMAIGDYTYDIIFENIYGNTMIDSVVVTVYIPDLNDPVITSTPSDITVTLSVGAMGESISWTATDLHAATYIIKVNGTTDVSATPWVSGTPVNYYAFYITGATTYEITFSDNNGNSVSDSVTMTVHPIPPATTPPPGIPGFEPLIVIGIVAIGSIGLIVLKKKKK